MSQDDPKDDSLARVWREAHPIFDEIESAHQAEIRELRRNHASDCICMRCVVGRAEIEMLNKIMDSPPQGESGKE